MTAVVEQPASGTEVKRDFRLIDSTLRDGSHAISHQYDVDQVVSIVKGLDAAGVQVIEVSHGDGLGGSSFNYGFSKVDEMQLVAAAVEATTNAQIAVLLVPGIGTVDELKKVRDLGVGVARIAVHCTEARAGAVEVARTLLVGRDGVRDRE